MIPSCYIPEGQIPLHLDLGSWASEGDADAWTLIQAYACEYPRVATKPPRYLERIQGEESPTYLALAYRCQDGEAVAVFTGEEGGVMSCLFNVTTEPGESKHTAQAFILMLAEGGCWIAPIDRANPPEVN